MHAHDQRDQFSPPSPPGRLRAVALAVVVHAALIAALTMGVDWTTTTDQPAVEAELWSAVPQQAAPALVAPPPPAPPTPAEPPPPPVAVVPPPPPPRAQEKSDPREADIAIEREKKRLEQEKRERAEQQERQKRERERREKLEAEKKERLQKEKERELKEKQEAQKRAEQKKQAEEKRRAEEAEAKRKATAEAEAKRKAEADAKRRADAEAKELAALRDANMRRIQGMAGATGGENATGKNKVSSGPSGPSGSYGGKVAAKVKPNIVYPDAISGNPRAVVEVRAAPDGTIVGKKLIQSSGNKAWDDAVLRALEKTETLPRDVDGRVPSSLEIGFRPQD